MKLTTLERRILKLARMWQKAHGRWADMDRSYLRAEVRNDCARKILKLFPSKSNG